MSGIGGTRALGLAVVLWVMLAPEAARADVRPGDPDTAFSGDGLAQVAIAEGDGADFASAIQPAPNGGTIIAGSIYAPGAPPYEGTGFAIARLDSSGELDRTFGDEGRVILPPFPDGPIRNPSEVAVAQNGDIFVSGFDRAEGSATFSALKLESNGAVDESFGASGVGGVTFEEVDGGGVRAIELDSQGRLLIGGSAVAQASRDYDYDFAIARLTPEGAPDPAFGDGGSVVLPIGTAGHVNPDIAQSLVATADGGTFVVGFTSPSLAAGSESAALAKLGPGGELDAGFGDGGVVVTSLGRSFVAEDVDVAGESVLVAGYGKTDAFDETSGAAVARYTSDGDLDSEFGGQGEAPAGIAFIPELSTARALALDEAGLIVVAGEGLGPTFSVARMGENGELDPTFGQEGVAEWDLIDEVNGNESVTDVFVRDNRIVLGGYADFGQPTGYDFAVTRLHARRIETPDTTAPAMEILTRKARFVGRRAVVRVACPPEEVSSPCTGTLELSRAADETVIADGEFSIAAGDRQLVSLRLLRGIRHRSIGEGFPGTLTIVSSDTAGNSSVASQPIITRADR